MTAIVTPKLFELHACADSSKLFTSEPLNICHIFTTVVDVPLQSIYHTHPHTTPGSRM